MKRFLVVLALLLGVSGLAAADGLNLVVDSTTRNPAWTVQVFNDQGAEIVSGDVVAWDDDDTDFSTSEYPYVILAATADDPYVAGVVSPNTRCADQAMCTIVVYGPTLTKIADSTDDATVDTYVATSTVSGRAGDAGQGANTTTLGLLVDIQDAGTDGAVGTVFVNISGD